MEFGKSKNRISGIYNLGDKEVKKVKRRPVDHLQNYEEHGNP